jgi:CRP-like cAMP-binding protein
MSCSSEIRTILRDKALFAEFKDDELDEFMALCEQEKAAAGQLLVRQEARGDCMYVMVKGRAKVIHHREGHNIELAVLKSGDFYGELALVDEGARSADVLAMDDCVVLKITHASIAALAGIYPMAAFKFLIAVGRILVDRLRHSTARYVDSLLFPISPKD